MKVKSTLTQRKEFSTGTLSDYVGTYFVHTLPSLVKYFNKKYLIQQRIRKKYINHVNQ